MINLPKGLAKGSPLYRNTYECPCGNAWEDHWDCGCDDECAACGATISPSESERLDQGQLAESASAWAPRPNPRYGSIERHDYHAGYSDAYYAYHFGAGHAGPSAAYRSGWTDGKSDRAVQP